MKKACLLVLLCTSFAQAGDTTDIVSISGLIEDYDRSITHKNADAAIQSLTRLWVLISTDYEYFNKGQIDCLEERFTKYSAEIKNKLNIARVETYVVERGPLERSWLLSHVEQDKIHIDWSIFLSGFNVQHSEEELKAHRVAMLRSFVGH